MATVIDVWRAGEEVIGSVWEQPLGENLNASIHSTVERNSHIRLVSLLVNKNGYQSNIKSRLLESMHVPSQLCRDAYECASHSLSPIIYYLGVPVERVRALPLASSPTFSMLHAEKGQGYSSITHPFTLLKTSSSLNLCLPWNFTTR